MVIPEDDALGEVVIQALSRLDRPVADRVLLGCLFAMSGERAVYVPAEVIRGRHLILLPRNLLDLPSEEGLRVVLHEIAHYILGHQSPRLGSFMKEQYQEQENEARRLADQWLKGPSPERS
jgi:hypothetical protein